MTESDDTDHLIRPDDKKFLQHYTTAWSSGDESLLREVFADNGVYIDSGMGHTYTGVADVARFFRHMLRFSSDTLVDFTSIVSDGNAFVAEWIWSGTADGPLSLGEKLHPPTGRRYSVPGVAVCRSDAAGRVSYHKDYYDVRNFIQQLGIDD
ncbi:nuclear transport factor 2 family protein [Gordonia polyisoprenivorans]|uniref:nuclear transport factor 2 family protein n=1 Tax=Gordonia polyisoprenivorans TaxID=84595 RepID=UPI001AD71E96|nr:nuclear transport factor 2 family protein [Gordonia polyisoprenivorans]QTI69032.1 nuclear transport factor 2 family protein [Gordonia polyisoprenivorans]